ncbi:MAG: RdgB/HAM1 family non-canonical purine NTP pyrophosphatase [Candidatus Rokubacteria bacterium]|nr:RdgB/HAM1 family non-canonical purine NTP pyrophosphatase [Candidatus Rokubacteria bacterium]MBI2554556.1 RdgB/HAM1 family non-canonical purine NTP pyrophosphatase [Candidatus Rokubacteria bacterium]
MARRASRSRPRLVLASLNPGKARELASLLGDLPFEVVSLSTIPGAALPPEGDESYRANAIAKARAAVRAAGAIAMADDSGLEVDALGGRPGVHSARYGGPGLSDAERCAALLAQLKGAAPERRTARFRCVVALVAPDGREEVVEGAVEGVITDAPRGTGGFGYDPLFYYPPLGRTFAELDPSVKNGISHRARAVAAAREVLKRWVS